MLLAEQWTQKIGACNLCLAICDDYRITKVWSQLYPKQSINNTSVYLKLDYQNSFLTTSNLCYAIGVYKRTKHGDVIILYLL